ncbi:MAG TPA: glycosyltransferase, partial [Chitinophagaceae bacterium]|nr:glycosyltransferase [Chitinophagaceae bacterium]
MTIIIDLTNKCLSNNALRDFTYGFWQDLAATQPAASFTLLGPVPARAQPAANTILKPWRKTGLAWLDHARYRRLVKRLQADRVITVDQLGFLIADAGRPGKQQGKPAQTRVLLAGQDTSLVPSYMPAAIIHPAMAEDIPVLTWAEEESIKTSYTGGRSYFLFTGDISEQHLLIDLLKAFSTFKKWQLSNMQLVIAGSSTGWTDQLEEKLASYKYRQDVVVLKDADNASIARLVAACYAMVYPVIPGIYPLGLVWAIQGRKAVIASSSETGRR